MKESVPEIRYAPPRWYKIVAGIPPLLFFISGAAILFLKSSETTFFGLGAKGLFLLGLSMIVFGFIGIVGVVNLHFSSLKIYDSEIKYSSLFKRNRIAYSDILEARIEDCRLHIKLMNGEWKHLPSWLGRKQVTSARKRIGNKIKVAPRSK